jgi:hypothetical protein
MKLAVSPTFRKQGEKVGHPPNFEITKAAAWGLEEDSTARKPSILYTRLRLTMSGVGASNV